MLVKLYGQIKYVTYLCIVKLNNMNFEFFDILVAGSTTLTSLLLLLAVPEVLLEDANTKRNIENMLSKHPEYSNDIDVIQMIKFIYNDGFEPEIYLDQNNITYLYELKLLKETFIEYYFKSLEEVKTNQKYVCDVHKHIGNYSLQLLRLRSVIKPEFNISLNPHKQTGNEYLVVKSYWLDDSGKKIRKFTKSIGRREEFPGDIRKNMKAKAVALEKIKEVMFLHYKEIYM